MVRNVGNLFTRICLNCMVRFAENLSTRTSFNKMVRNVEKLSTRICLNCMIRFAENLSTPYKLKFFGTKCCNLLYPYKFKLYGKIR